MVVKGGSHKMSLREKNLYRRRVNREHNSNFRAGYVNVNEEQLHKTGIRGRKTYTIYFITCLVIATMMVNLMITFILFGTLHLSKDGMESLEFIPMGRLLRFLVDSNVEDVYLLDNTMGGFTGEELEITAEEGEILLRILQEHGSSVHIDNGGIVINSTNGVTIRDPDTGGIIFSTDYAKHARFPHDVTDVRLQEVVTGRVTSDVNEDLILKATGVLSVRGGAGVQAQTKQLALNARKEVNVTATEGGLTLDAAAGVELQRVRDLPRHDETLPTNPELGHKICVCMPAGKLFAILDQYDCHEVANADTICAASN